MFNLLLVIHIGTGIICLLTGLLAGFSKKKKGSHTLFGEVYHGSFVLVFLTALAMSVLHWEESAYLFYIAIFSYSLALFGYLAGKRRWKNWIKAHIGGMLGSYIGIVTATLVVNAETIPILSEWPILVIWFAPTIIGTPLIFLITNRYIPNNRQR